LAFLSAIEQAIGTPDDCGILTPLSLASNDQIVMKSFAELGLNIPAWRYHCEIAD
jgi:hypothetical protein